MHRCGTVMYAWATPLFTLTGTMLDHVSERRNDPVSDTDACHNVIKISALFVCTRAHQLWVLMQNFTTSAPDTRLINERRGWDWSVASKTQLLFVVLSNVWRKRETSTARGGRLPEISLIFKENIEATFSTQICESAVAKVQHLKAFWFVLEGHDDAASSPIKTTCSCVRSLMSLESTTGADVMGHEKLISLCVNEGGRFWFIPNLHTQFTFQKEAILLISMKLGVCYGLTWKHGIHESVQRDSGSEDITHGK